jgi:hypothetical protein
VRRAPALERKCREVGNKAARDLREIAISDEVLPLDFIDLQLRRTYGPARRANGFQAQQHRTITEGPPAQHIADVVERRQIDAEQGFQGGKVRFDEGLVFGKRLRNIVSGSPW